MNIQVAINGFGRIGRLVARAMLERPGFRIVAVHDLANAESLAHLLKYDTVHGRIPGKIAADSGYITYNPVLDGKPLCTFKVISGKTSPSQIDWGSEVDVVIEATGLFRAKAKADKDGFDGHLGRNGCKKVVLTVPPDGPIDATIVMGVNEEMLKPDHHCVSNASCTTNCLAPVAKILHDRFGIVRGLMNTIHAFTNDQVTADQIHSDLRRARTASQNIILTSTGAAKAIGVVIPELAGKLDGFATRVPVPDASMVDLSIITEEAVTKEVINAAMKEAAEGPLAGILQYCDEPIVSSDVIGNSHSAVFDSLATMVSGGQGNLVKVVAWYDNEWAYSIRVVGLIKLMAERGYLG